MKFFPYEIGTLAGWELIMSPGIIYCISSHGTSSTIKLSAWVTSDSSFPTLPLTWPYMCRVMWSLIQPQKGKSHTDHWDTTRPLTIPCCWLWDTPKEEAGFWKWFTRISSSLESGLFPVQKSKETSIIQKHFSRGTSSALFCGPSFIIPLRKLIFFCFEVPRVVSLTFL